MSYVEAILDECRVGFCFGRAGLPHVLPFVRLLRTDQPGRIEFRVLRHEPSRLDLRRLLR